MSAADRGGGGNHEHHAANVWGVLTFLQKHRYQQSHALP